MPWSCPYECSHASHLTLSFVTPPNGAYQLAELDDAVSKLRFAAFRLVPYHAHSRSPIPITRVVERENLVKIHLDEDLEGAAALDPGDGASSDESDFEAADLFSLV
jgi:hypothetical protein